jgi:aryl-alcohol dehydrogenase-like predicted oxidoreductase
MERTMLAGTDLEVSRLSLGTWAFGSDPMWGAQDDSDSVAVVSAALDAGIDFIDTAAGYADGRSEEVLGRALAGRRDRAIVATKVYGTLAGAALVEACEASLRRLGTDYVDAYYLHWPNHDIPIAESLEGLRKLKAAGKIRAAGICNFGPVDLADLKAAKDAGVVVLHQLPYSLFWRAIEYDILPATRAIGLDVVAYSVLAQGLLTGRYTSSAEVPQSLHATRFYGDGPHGDPGADGEVFAALPGLRALADEARVSLPDLAIQWALAQPGVAVVLTGARTPAEIEANAKALDVKVEPAALAAATALSEPVKAKLGRNPDMWMAGEKSRFR